MHRHSALETIYKVGKYSSSEKQSLTFKELTSLEILQIACWPHKIDEMNNLTIQWDGAEDAVSYTIESLSLIHI